MFATVILMVIFGFFSYKNLLKQEESITRESQSRGRFVASVAKNGLITLMLDGRGTEYKTFVESLVADELEAVRLYSASGELIASTPSAGAPSLRREDMSPGIHIEDDGTEVFTVSIPIFNDRPCLECHPSGGETLAYLNVSISLAGTYSKISTLRKDAAISFAVALLLLSASLALMTTLLVNRPLRRIIATMKRVEEGDLDARVNMRRYDEIGSLARSFDSMLKQLSEARQRLESYHLESMQQVEKMATIGELAAAIAHEIKNPLAGISGAIQVFADDFADDDPRREIINDVLGEIERLDKAVRDLLNFARPPAPSFIRANVDEIVERTLRLIKGKARKQGVNMVHVPSDEQIVIKVDPDQIQQVMLNLIMNALHSMPGGGAVTIKTSMRPSGEVEVAIEDTGPGIAPEHLAKIFKPFFTTKSTGTGLGLAICKNIIEKHSGRLEVHSSMGKGAKFAIILPSVEDNG